jgi:hypothetical protein
MARVIFKRIALALVNGENRKLSKRDVVETFDGASEYRLWGTWIVRRNKNGELEWNTDNFRYSGTNTTRSRFKHLPAAIIDAEVFVERRRQRGY